MKKIGFIGLGIMGKNMAKNLMKNGFEVNIFARSKPKVEDIIAEGAVFHGSIKDCVKDCECVITIVGYPKDVEEIYLGKGNIFDSAEKGAYLIDMTTSSPSLAEKLHAEGKKRGFHVMDAPVTGGETGAKNGTLSILAAGEKEDFDKCMPVFKAMGTNIRYQGKAGNGQHAKLANQIMIAGTMSGLCEGLAYAKSKNLDLNTFIESVATGAAGSRQLDTFSPKIISGDFSASFYMKHFIKDMKIALEESKESGLNLEILADTLKNYKELEAKGYSENGTQALIKHYLK